MDVEVVKARVAAKLRAGEFVFAEDEVRAIAEALDVDVDGTPFGKVAPANSPTRGDVPPFSGTPASPEFAAEGSEEAVQNLEDARTEAIKEAKTGRPMVTRDSIGADPGLEEEVESHDSTYPDTEPVPAGSDVDSTDNPSQQGGSGGVNPDDYSKEELEDLAEEQGVSRSGTKEEIAARLK